MPRHEFLILLCAAVLHSRPGEARTASDETRGGRQVAPSNDAARPEPLRPAEGARHDEHPGRMGEIERRMIGAGLIRLRALDPTLLAELKYSSPDNFMGVDVYGALQEPYLQPEAARMLKRAHEYLKAENPRLRLLIVDGCRPRSVQRKMWKIVAGTPKQRYVANPAGGSLHNYGAAVDLTIGDEHGNRLDMGTPMDHFGPLAQPRQEERFLRAGKLTRQQVAARRLLRRVMVRAGFHPLSIEWWHFSAFDRKTVRRRYRIIE